MKCSSCSGVSPEGSRFCQFCGNSAFVAPVTSATEVATSITPDPAALIESAVQIKRLPKNGFRWLPFFFNISYLAGYGNTREANRATGILLAGYLVAAVMHFIGLYDLAKLVFIGNGCFGLWYSYMISTRIDALVQRGKPFNWTIAIGYWLLYVIVSSALTSRI